jgi:ribosomal protein S18 acetylase RimI-like enzyme
MVYLFEIEVAAPYRRQGIGKQLIARLKTLCRDSDVEDIWVGTDHANVAAKRLYASTGGSCVAAHQCEFIYALYQEPLPSSVAATR